MKKALIFLFVIAAVLAACLSVTGKYDAPKTTEMSYASLAKPQSWTGLYLAGQHAVRKSRFSEASEFFAQSLEKQQQQSPKTIEPGMQAQIMNLLLAAGKYEDALKIANQLNEKDDSASAGLLQYARKLEDEDYAGAIAVLDRLAGRDETNVTHQILRAWAKIGTGDNAAATAIMQELTKGKNFKSLVYYHYALISEFNGDDTKAEELYKFLTAKQKIPTKIAEKAHDFFVKTGNNKAIEEILEKDFDKENLHNYGEISSVKEGAADAFIELGTLLLAEENYSKATVFFRLGLLLEPSSDEASLLLGTIFVNEKDFVAANVLLKNVSEKSYFYDMAQVAIAANYKDMNNEVAAKQYLEKLAEKPKTKIQALVNLGDIAREHEDFEMAKKHYSQAIAAFEKDKKLSPFYWGVYFARGVSFERLKQWPEAEKDFQKALELEPNQPDVLNYFGYSLLDMNKTERFDEAKKLIEAAAEQRPDDPHVVDSIGWVWFKMGDYAKAVKFLEKASQDMPYDPTINEHLGDAYWKLGRENEARFAWQRALDNEPEERFLAGIEAKLKHGLDYSESDLNKVEKPHVKTESAR